MPIILLMILVGFYGFKTSNSIIRYFEGGHGHFRFSVEAANEISSNAKRAEGHLMLLITLNSEEDRGKFFERYAAIQEQINTLHKVMFKPGPRRILDSIKSNTEKLKPLGESLLEVYDRDMEHAGRFEPKKHKELILEFHDVSSAIRSDGVKLANNVTSFLNKQVAITAANEISSYAKRAEGHLLLFLTLNREIDRGKFFKRYASIQELVNTLDMVTFEPGSKRILNSIKSDTDKLKPLGESLLEVYDKDMKSTGRFEPEKHKELILEFHDVSSAIRSDGVKLVKINIAHEDGKINSTINGATLLQRNIVILLIISVIAALIFSLRVARTIAHPVKILEDATRKIANGDLDTKIEIKTKDEVGQLATSFNSMVSELKRTTVSRDMLLKEITTRKKAAEALRESEERYRAVIQTAVEAIITSDSKGNIESWNRGAQNIFGYMEEEVLGKQITILVPERYRDKHIGGMERFALTSEAHIIGKTVGFHGLTKDGREFPLELSLARWETKGEQFYTGIINDITERKSLEEESLKAQKLESVGLLAGGIAHDFNNILTGITGNISLAKNSLGTDKAHERLTAAEGALTQAASLANQLLTFSKGGEPIKETSCIGRLIKDSVSFSLRGSNIKYEFFICDDLWPVDIDKGQINQVISNIIINARQAMTEGGVLMVGAENLTIGTGTEDTIDESLKEERYIKISIEDNGTGIDQEHLEKIFDPYFSTKEEGSGLGLATSYSIIKKHGGRIIAESLLGAGTTFYIYLPASKDKVSEDKGREVIITKLTEKKHNGRKVLVMDDEEIIRDVLGEMLTSLGYEMDFAINGNEATELYSKAIESGKPFDAVIVDLTIPGGMGGEQAVKKLLEIDPGVKAIVSSGYSNDPVMAKYEEYGFVGVITKPYVVAELNEKLHKIIAGES